MAAEQQLNRGLSLLQAGSIAGSIAVLITAPVAWGIAALFGLGWGVAYAIIVSFVCTFVPLRRWCLRRELMADASKTAWRDTAG